MPLFWYKRRLGKEKNSRQSITGMHLHVLLKKKKKCAAVKRENKTSKFQGTNKNEAEERQRRRDT